MSADHAIVACFLLNQYTVTASAGSGGTISNPGITSVHHGDNLSYTISSDTGYLIDEITVNGSLVVTSPAAPYPYTFTGISGNGDIAATFSPITYTLTGISGTHGILT